MTARDRAASFNLYDEDYQGDPAWPSVGQTTLVPVLESEFEPMSETDDTCKKSNFEKTAQ
jgi:hypothetical protein